MWNRVQCESDMCEICKPEIRKECEKMKLEEKVKGIIAEQLVVDLEIVTMTAELVEDLGADSLDLVELIMAMEESFDLEVADEDAEKITTVQEVVDAVKKEVEP